MHPQLERTRDKDDISSALREALDIVEELEPPADLRELCFQLAAQLTTQTAQRVGIPLGHSTLLGG